jgi:hypothetical protein
MNSFARNALFDRKFREELGRLRARIETVPAAHRKQLLSFADVAQEQHEKMRETSRWIDDMVADLGLTVEHTNFHVEACRRELRELDPEGRFQI